MRLSDFRDDGKGNPVLGDSSKFAPITVSVYNIDDLFTVLMKFGFKEIEVSPHEMHMIVRFYLANIGNDKNGNQGKVMREGKIDQFFGVKLLTAHSNTGSAPNTLNS